MTEQATAARVEALGHALIVDHPWQTGIQAHCACGATCGYQWRPMVDAWFAGHLASPAGREAVYRAALTRIASLSAPLNGDNVWEAMRQTAREALRDAPLGDTTLPQQRAELERQRVIKAGELATLDELLAENASAQQYPPSESRSYARALEEGRAQAPASPQPPIGWYCGCGHPNGIALSVCACCGRAPGGPENPVEVFYAQPASPQPCESCAEKDAKLARLLRGDYTPEEIATVQIRELLAIASKWRLEAEDRGAHAKAAADELFMWRDWADGILEEVHADDAQARSRIAQLLQPAPHRPVCACRHDSGASNECAVHPQPASPPGERPDQGLIQRAMDALESDAGDAQRRAAWNELRDWLDAADAPRGVVDGTLYCYGGCGRRYEDFGLDVLLPTAVWNQIAVGLPFDESMPNVEREGRGGVLCAQCIVDRLAGLPGVTAAFVTTEDMRSASRPTEAPRPEGARTPALLRQRAAWYRAGCPHMEDGDSYFTSKDIARDAADDLDAALNLAEAPRPAPEQER